MARRWTPQRFVIMRRLRVFICVLALIISSTGIFALSARKSIALIINGKTKVVTTYASTTQRLLQEQKVPVKTHDQVISTSGDILADHATVTVRSAYQTSITVDGVTIPFWTVATSIDQLIGFFQANADHAAKITVNLQNIYNKLTGGLSINKKGPVTVICDNKTRVVPDGTLPASSILDSLGIVLGKEDQVTVSEENGKTLLRILRVTHGKESRNVVIPFSTINVNDSSLAIGARVIKQAGANGERIDLYNVTYVDGKAQSATLIKQSIVKPSIDQIVAIGAKSTPKTQNESKPSKQINKQEENKKPNSQTPAPADNPNGMVHATPEQAKLYAQAACAQLGWTGAMWEDLVKLWTKESNWRWNAENKSSGAYGIPQSLPADKMASAGANWHEDASIQITWGLSYIRSKYGNPSEAWKHSQEIGWY
ncbi:G5 domain-containing protein [Gardnerella piotii]|uniref:aggregation-promoting factor C-terminal-like domain-containing protein n=1 Tax=Gardnerella piotii TaxID=2792977 RepID=UPI003D07F3A6